MSILFLLKSQVTNDIFRNLFYFEGLGLGKELASHIWIAELHSARPEIVGADSVVAYQNIAAWHISDGTAKFQVGELVIQIQPFGCFLRKFHKECPEKQLFQRYVWKNVCVCVCACVCACVCVKL